MTTSNAMERLLLLNATPYLCQPKPRCFLWQALQFTLALLITLSYPLLAQAQPSAKTHQRILIISEAYTQQTNDFIRDYSRLVKQREGITVQQSRLDNWQQTDLDPTMVVTLGKRVLRSSELPQDIPTLGTLLSRISFSDQTLQTSDHTYGLFSDPSPRHQLALVKALYGSSTHTPSVGLITSPRSSYLTPILTSLSNQLSVNLVSETAQSNMELPAALARLKNSHNYDSLILFPDRRLYNANNIKLLLLSAYRNNKPVVGFSRQLVKAGAIASIYYSPQSLASKAVELSIAILDNHKLAPFNYPDEFDIEFNHGIARSLNLPFKNTREVHNKVVKILEEINK